MLLYFILHTHFGNFPKVGQPSGNFANCVINPFTATSFDHAETGISLNIYL